MKSCGIGCADHLKICRAATQQFFIFKFSFLIFSSRWRGSVGPFRSSKALSRFLPPAGEGVAHKGDRRGRARRERNVEMTASRGEKQRFYRLQAVRFSLFRHPPRGGSADATFPRWGKEMGESTQRPCRGRSPARGRPRSNGEMIKNVRRIRTRPVARADPGAPRSNSHVFHNFRRIRKRIANSPRLSRVGPCAARKGQALSLQWDGCEFAERGSSPLVLLRGAPGSARPTMRCCEFAERDA